MKISGEPRKLSVIKATSFLVNLTRLVFISPFDVSFPRVLIPKSFQFLSYFSFILLFIPFVRLERIFIASNTSLTKFSTKMEESMIHGRHLLEIDLNSSIFSKFRPLLIVTNTIKIYIQLKSFSFLPSSSEWSILWSEERISKKSIEESQNLIAKRSKKVKKQYFQFSSIPPQFRKKKKIEDCRGDCCQSKVIPDKGYTTRSITSKKIAITTGLLSIDGEDPSIVKAWIGYPDAVWADILWTVSSSSAVKPADYRPLDPFTPVIHYPIRGTPDNGGRSRCDHARRNRWTRETTTPLSRSLDGRIKADDDVGSWEKGLILARSILTAVKEERVRKFPFQGIVSRGIRGNSSVFFWLSRGRNKSNYRRNVSSEFEDRVNIQSSIKSLFCRMEKKV